MKLNFQIDLSATNDLAEINRVLLIMDDILAKSTTKFVRPGLQHWYSKLEGSQIWIVPYEVTLDCFELMEAYKNAGYEVDEDNQVIGINNNTGKCIVKDMVNEAYHVGTVHLSITDDKLSAEIESDQGDDENTYQMNVYA